MLVSALGCFVSCFATGSVSIQSKQEWQVIGGAFEALREKAVACILPPARVAFGDLGDAKTTRACGGSFVAVGAAPHAPIGWLTLGSSGKSRSVHTTRPVGQDRPTETTKPPGRREVWRLGCGPVMRRAEG